MNDHLTDFQLWHVKGYKVVEMFDISKVSFDKAKISNVSTCIVTKAYMSIDICN